MDGKLIIVFIVLASTPLASAEWIGFKLAEDSIIAPGSTVTINVIADLTSVSVEFGVVSDFGAGGAVVDQGTLGEDATYSSIMTGVRHGTVDNYNGVLFHQSGWHLVSSVEPWVLLVSFDYTINPDWDGVSDIVIAPLAVGTDYEYAPGLFDTAWRSFGALSYDYPYDQIVVDISGLTIPEPGTVFLFGLGSLAFIRNRRRQVSPVSSKAIKVRHGRAMKQS